MSPYHHSLITSEMENYDLSDKGVNETRTFGDGLSPGRCSIEMQCGSGHHQTTAKGLIKKDNSETTRKFINTILMNT